MDTYSLKKLKMHFRYLLLSVILFPNFTCDYLSAKGSDSFAYNKFETTAKMRAETQYVLKCIEEAHYSKNNIDEISGKDFLTSHFNKLDRSRLFFKLSDVDELILRFAKPISYYLRQGNLFPAFEIFKIYHQNATERFKWVFKTLETKKFDFSTEDYFRLDRSESSWFTSDLEADQIWHQRLKYEILNEILNEILTLSLIQSNKDNPLDSQSGIENIINAKPPKQMDKVYPNDSNLDNIVITENILLDSINKIKRRYERILNYHLEMEPDEVQEEFLTSLTAWYDPHSQFFSDSSLEEFKIGMENSFVGIGAVLTMEDGYCTIKSLLAGAPAQKSKALNAGDKIVSIAQGKDQEFVDVVDMKLKKIVKLIRGEEGSEVVFLINPSETKDPSARKEVTIKRGEVKITERLASAKVFNLPAGNKTSTIGVIELPSFYGSSKKNRDGATNDVEQLIEKLKEIKVEGIILDLRLNGGGLLNEAVDLTGLFIKEGSVVQIRGSNGLVKQLKDENPKISWEGPLAIMISRNSASASEIVAGALQNYKRALILGDTSTHGKGTVQLLLKMNETMGLLDYFTLNRPQYGGAKITVQKYFLPNGHSTQLKGVSSDIVFPSMNEFLPIGETDLENTLSWEKIPSVPLDANYQTYNVDKELVMKLKSSYLLRKESMHEFAFLEKRITKMKELKEQKLISLNFNLRKKQKWIDSQYNKLIDKTREELIEGNHAFEEILLPAALDQIDNENTLETDLPEEDPILDIPLRESLRLMNDWIKIVKNDTSNSSLSLLNSKD